MGMEEKVDLKLDNINFKNKYGRNKTISVFTLGCKVNTYDTQAMLELFKNKGYENVDFEEKADVYLINTCTVTNLSDKKSRQFIRKARRQNNNAIVVAVGCYSQVFSKKINNMPDLNIIIGNKNKSKIVEEVESYSFEEGIKNKVEDIRKEYIFENLYINNLENRTRAYLKIQEGCNQYCSYCIIPYARGPVRSRNIEDIIKEVKRLTENKFKEIVLTGIHVSSYGKDLKNTNLIELLKKINNINKLERIRFSSIEPNLINEEFISTIRNLSKICDHFHLSLQSGCDKILKLMNRKYTTYNFEKSVEMLRNIMENVSITTDIIVGFPNESIEDFKETLKFIEKIRPSKVHVFPYSSREGTKASKMKGQISNKNKTERVKELIDLTSKLEEEFIKSSINKNFQVLYEKKLENNIYEGYTTNYIKVKTFSEKNIENKIFTTKIVKTENFYAISEKI